MKKESRSNLLGIIVLLGFILLAFFEYKQQFPQSNLNYNGTYVDYTLLLSLSKWTIYFFLLLSGISMLFRLSITNHILLIFSMSALLEFYLNSQVYLTKSLTGPFSYVLLIFALFLLPIAAFNLLKIKRVNFAGAFSSLLLSVITVYLSNALITYYF